jgi:hypothetical protein
VGEPARTGERKIKEKQVNKMSEHKSMFITKETKRINMKTNGRKTLQSIRSVQVNLEHLWRNKVKDIR